MRTIRTFFRILSFEKSFTREYRKIVPIVPIVPVAGAPASLAPPVPDACGRRPDSPAAARAEDYTRFMAIMAAAFDRLRVGERTYGAFSPATDRRDLLREAEEELLDAIVYAYLAILKLEVAEAECRPEGLGRRPANDHGIRETPSGSRRKA
jgi:hypothetical protein